MRLRGVHWDTDSDAQVCLAETYVETHPETWAQFQSSQF